MPFAVLALAAAALASLSPQDLLQSVTSSDPMFGHDPVAPVAAPGLWAAETPGCGGTRGPDLAAWPDCAQPVQVGAGDVALLSPGREGPPLRMLTTRFTLAPAWPGSPPVVQIEVPGLLDTTFVYGALMATERDAQGRLVAARVRPIPCPGQGVDGVGAEAQGCTAATPTGVHEAARRAALAPSPGVEIALRRVGR